MIQPLVCPVCASAATLLDSVDFNKSCEEASGKSLSASGILVDYALCGACGFCFAPELMAWDLAQFAARIYNDEYAEVDPEYQTIRPQKNAATLISVFGDHAHSIRHLDYGGGNGQLAQHLGQAHWQSTSYDPFVDGEAGLAQLGQFDLITAFEVFEHVPDVHALMATLCALRAPDGLVLFSTRLSDGYIQPNQKLKWWYAAPRNGHISLFSKASLGMLAKKYALNLHSFSEGTHLMFETIPPWAAAIIQI